MALEEARFRQALRIRTTHEGHPLALRAAHKIIQRGIMAGQTQRDHTNLQRTARLLPAINRLDLYLPRYNEGSRLSPIENTPKEDAAKQFKEWFAS